MEIIINIFTIYAALTLWSMYKPDRHKIHDRLFKIYRTFIRRPFRRIIRPFFLNAMEYFKNVVSNAMEYFKKIKKSFDNWYKTRIK
jgi:hypothetical protein